MKQYIINTITRDQVLVDRIISLLIENGGSIKNACESCGITRSFLTKWRADDKDFDAEIMQALRASTEVQEDKIVDLCREGIETPLLYQGEVVAYKRDFNPKFFSILLQARKPEVYSPRVDVKFPELPNAGVKNTLSLAANHVTDLEQVHGGQKKIAAPGQDAAIEFGLPGLSTVKPAGEQESS